MALPERYVGPSKEGGPKMILGALKLLGTVEAAGFKGHLRILAWSAEVGLAKTYSHDPIPWCGLFPAPNDRNTPCNACEARSGAGLDGTWQLQDHAEVYPPD